MKISTRPMWIATNSLKSNIDLKANYGRASRIYKLSYNCDTTIFQSLLACHFNKNQLLLLLHCTVAAWCRNVETNATSQIWEENLRNPCDSTSNLKLQTRGGQVANARWDKTGSCRATNEGDWVTPTSEASPGVHYSKKHPFVVISIEKN